MSSHRIRAYIADSDPDFTRIFAQRLSEIPGIKVIGTSSDISTASDEIAEQIPDVLITDLFLPRKSPEVFLRPLAEKLVARMPAVIVCSGFINRGMFAAIEGYNVYRYFIKPVCCSKLADTVREAFLMKETKDNRSLVSTVTVILEHMGSPTEQKGYSYLRDGIIMYAETDKDRSLSIMDIYKALADKYSTTPACVERVCRNTVKTIWEKGNRDILDNLFAKRVSEHTNRPTNSRFISTLAARLYSL